MNGPNLYDPNYGMRSAMRGRINARPRYSRANSDYDAVMRQEAMRRANESRSYNENAFNQALSQQQRSAPAPAVAPATGPDVIKPVDRIAQRRQLLADNGAKGWQINQIIEQEEAARQAKEQPAPATAATAKPEGNNSSDFTKAANTALGSIAGPGAAAVIAPTLGAPAPKPIGTDVAKTAVPAITSIAGPAAAAASIPALAQSGPPQSPASAIAPAKPPSQRLIDGIPSDQWFQREADKTGENNMFATARPKPQPAAQPAQQPIKKPLPKL